MPLDPPIALIGFAVMAAILFLWLGGAVSEFLLGRYLARNHPETWLSLGRPGRIGSFRRNEPDCLTGWLQRGAFEAIDDTRLHAKCRFARHLSRISIIAFVVGLSGMLIALFLSK
jgi:hypothetical protein